jgi:hypothetical protein
MQRRSLVGRWGGVSFRCLFSFALFCFCGAAVEYGWLGGFGQDFGVWNNGVMGRSGFWLLEVVVCWRFGIVWNSDIGLLYRWSSGTCRLVSRCMSISRYSGFRGPFVL